MCIILKLCNVGPIPLANAVTFDMEPSLDTIDKELTIQSSFIRISNRAFRKIIFLCTWEVSDKPRGGAKGMGRTLL